MTRITIELDNETLEKLDEISSESGYSRSQQIEGMIEAEWQARPQERLPSLRVSNLSQSDAIRIGCRVAGIAGAFVPRELSRISHCHAPLLTLLRAAERAAEEADYQSNDWIAEHGLRTFSHDASGRVLQWITSVVTEIAVSPDGWTYEVTVYGEHIPTQTDESRWGVLRAAAAEISAEATEQELSLPTRAMIGDGYLLTRRAIERQREMEAACNLPMEHTMTTRSNDELRKYRSDLVHTKDTRIIASIDAVLSGDESSRWELERALDQIDRDADSYAD